MDIDGDGDLDAFVGNTSGDLLFFENLGTSASPIFASPSTDPFGLTGAGHVTAPTFADIDGDGDPDAIVGEVSGNTLFFENTGTASVPAFAALVINPFGFVDIGTAGTPAFGDFDGDGDLDALMGEPSGRFFFFRNSGSVTSPAFASPLTNPFGLADIADASTPALADVDGDADVDLLTGEFFGNTLFFRNTGTSTSPTFAAPVTNAFGLTDVGYFSAPTFADIDGDGDVDALVAEADGTTILFGNTGHATLPAFEAGSPATNPFGLMDVLYNAVPAFADIDGDGDFDAFLGRYSGHVFFFQNVGSASSPKLSTGNPFGLEAFSRRATVTLTDIDDDGDLDAFVGERVYGYVLFYENTGSSNAPSFASRQSNPFGLSSVDRYAAPTFADIDGDGDPDAFVGEQSGDVVFFENTGSPSLPAFASMVENPFGLTDVDGTSVLALVDIDADGDLDALIGGGDGNTAFFRNTGSPTSPTFAAAQVNPFGLAGVGEYAAPALADVDGDGDLDALIGESGGDTHFFANTGSATSPAFAAPQTNVAGLKSVGALAAPSFADVDGDGDLDVFVAAEYGLVVLFENTGGSSSPAFTAGLNDPFLVPRIGYYAAPAFADIDGDGDLDAFVGVESYAGETVFFENTGTAASPAFAPPVTNPFGLQSVGSGPRPTFADIDGDGDLDALIGEDDGITTLFENTGTVGAPAFAAGQVNPFGFDAMGGYGFAPELADLDGDGDLDVFIGRSDGNTIYFENTGSSTSPAFAAPEANPFGVRDIGAAAVPAFVDIDGDGDLDSFLGEYEGVTIFFRNGISNTGGRDVPHFMDYRIKESNRRIPGGALPGDCNLTFDDPLFDFGDGQSTAEIHELSFVRTLGLPAGENAEDGIDLAGTHLLGFLAKPGIKSALPVMDGLFQKGRRHAARIGIEVTIPTPTLHDGSGANTLRLDTKKGTRILVPANTSLIGVPAEPSEGTDHYKCYQVKTVASGPFGTLQDAAGRELRGLQVQVEDQFGDGQGHPVYGDARRFDLRNVTELCNPVAVSNVDTVEEDGGGRSRTTSCMVTPTSISHPNTSLLCWRTRVAVADIQQPWDGMSPATLIAPRQEKHEKRALATDNPVYLGHELAAPDRVDTVKEMQICFPVLVTDRGSIKP